jgi:predicted acylesterase/phospholipase RssA
VIGKLDSVRVLAFEGGGMLGLSYLRPIEMLEDAGVLERCHTFAGGSVGAIVAASLAVCPEVDPLERLLLDTDFEEVLDGGNSWWRLIRQGGGRTLDRPAAWLRKHFGKLCDPDMPLSAVPQVFGRELRVSVTDETREEDLVLGADSSITLIDAVLASMAVPVHFLPLEMDDGRQFSDGGLAANLPLTGITCPPEELLAFRLESSRGSNPVRGSGLLARAKRLVRVARRAANRGHIPSRYWDAGRIVTIDCGELEFDDWSIARRQRDRARLLLAGEQALDRWLAAA